MDTQIPPAEMRRRRLRRAAIPGLIAIAAFTALAFARGVLRPSVERDELRIATVERGRMLATLDASGVVLPLYERVITSPVDARIVEIHRRSGESVSAGTPILSLDASTVESDLTRIDRQIALRGNERDQLLIQIEGELRGLEAQCSGRRRGVHGDFAHELPGPDDLSVLRQVLPPCLIHRS